MTPTTIDAREIQNRINAYTNWYHQIELAPGIITPGINKSSYMLQILNDHGLPQDATGMRILDIGCRDGFFAFEMERRGAEVIGVDYAAPDVTGFSIVAEILASKVTYLVENVYDLSPETHGIFDVVLFLGVLYHLRNPLQALDGIRQVVKEGGLMFVETQLSTDPAVTHSLVPAWEFYPGDKLNNDDSNMWAPNMAALVAVVAECQFDVLNDTVSGDRGYVTARALADKRKDFYRQLDSSKDLYGKGYWKDTGLDFEDEIKENRDLHLKILPEKDEYIESLQSQISLLKHEAKETHEIHDKMFAAKDEYIDSMETRVSILEIEGESPKKLLRKLAGLVLKRIKQLLTFK